jgi:hypothetical protein
LKILKTYCYGETQIEGKSKFDPIIEGEEDEGWLKMKHTGKKHAEKEARIRDFISF